MIKEIIKYVNYFFNKAKQQYNHINDVVLKSALVYQYLYHKNFNEYISIDNILQLNNGEFGLLGPGNGRITRFLEGMFGQFDVLHSHSIIHDAFGRFYDHFKKDR